MALSVQISLKSTTPAFFWLPRWKPAFRPEYIPFGLAERRKEGDLIRNSLLINIIRKSVVSLGEPTPSQTWMQDSQVRMPSKLTCGPRWKRSAHER